jgi:hypothetical protein
MIVPIDDITFKESEYNRGGKIWKASTLYDFAKAREYPVMDMPMWNLLSVVKFIALSFK